MLKIGNSFIVVMKELKNFLILWLIGSFINKMLLCLCKIESKNNYWMI